MVNKIFTDWLHARKITDKVIRDFGLHTLPDGRLAIPINLPDGTFSFNKYRRSPLDEYGPKYTYDKGGKLALYGADKISDRKQILITEGEADTLVAWSANIPAVSGTGGAMSFDPTWKDLLSGKGVILCYDNDPAGGEGMAKAHDIIPHAKVLLLPDKPGVKDISDYVAHGGNLQELIKTARHYFTEEEVRSDMAERESQWMSVHFHRAWIKNHAKPPALVLARMNFRDRDARMGTKVERAKQYPITELLRFNHMGNCICPFHSETEGSLHYYKDQNKAWCFGGCGRGYDSIDIYQKLNNCGFKEAVEALQ